MYDVKEYMMSKNLDARKAKTEEIINRAIHGEGGLKVVLTKRQVQILSMVLSAKSNKAISEELGLVERTVEYHRNRIMGKLGVHNSVELTKLVISLGLDL